MESQETPFNHAAAPASHASLISSSELPTAYCLLPTCPQYRIEGSGPLLVYISGLDGTGELFFKQAPALAQSFRVVTFRQRDDGDFSYEDLADDVAAIIHSVGESRATLIAESFSGGVA